MSNKEEFAICALCGSEMYSVHNKHNPWPLADEGDCCSNCNMHLVIPERFKNHNPNHEDNL